MTEQEIIDAVTSAKIRHWYGSASNLRHEGIEQIRESVAFDVRETLKLINREKQS